MHPSELILLRTRVFPAFTEAWKEYIRVTHDLMCHACRIVQNISDILRSFVLLRSGSEIRMRRVGVLLLSCEKNTISRYPSTFFITR